jgi:acyl carrier protein
MQPGESFDAVEVRRYLQQKLPEYMIPSRMVVLDELPISPSGKVDRNALPAPDQDRLELGNVSQAPRTPTEVTLAAIWGEVLKLDKVGIYDNFFELGGHSLLATQVISRIRSVFSTDLPLRHMFESPTVAELAAMITQTQSKQAGDAELRQMLRDVEVMTEEEAPQQLVKETLRN